MAPDDEHVDATKKKPRTVASAHGLYETLVKPGVLGESRQDDGLPCGTKVVPIVAAISPLAIIVQEGSHRQSLILYHSGINGILSTPLHRLQLILLLTNI
jgi:hypothetical protein